MKLIGFTATFLSILFTIFIGSISAEIYDFGTMNYQGCLIDEEGNKYDGEADITFSIWNDIGDGEKLWEETHNNIVVVNGAFSVVLGTENSLNSLTGVDQYWLQIEIDAEDALPRIRLSSVPYSLNSKYLDGTPKGSFVEDGEENSITGAMIVDGTILLDDLNQNGAENDDVIQWSGSQWIPAAIPGVDCSSCDSRFINSDGDNLYGVLSIRNTSLSFYSDKVIGYIRADESSDYLNYVASHGIHRFISSLDGMETVLIESDSYDALVCSTSAEGFSGVKGVASVPEAAGVSGHNHNPGGYGVAGWSTDGKALYGYSSSGYAGYFEGNVEITGSLSKAAGSFKIDHPLYPESKFLFHSFVESPDMKNIYDGIAILNSDGQATVNLPDYFEALNKDFRYQLTCIGGYAQIYIAEEVGENQFRIAGGLPGMKVSWQVTGIRKDAYAEHNRIEVEVVKSSEEQGKYIHPEVFGFNAEHGINYHRPIETKSR